MTRPALLLALAAAGLLTTPTAAEAVRATKAPSPAAHEPYVAELVSSFLMLYHYAPKQLDDSLSACWYDSYLEALDPSRMILLDADVQEFATLRTRLDDALTAEPPDLGAPFGMYARWRERLTERTAAVHAAIDRDYDFGGSEAWQFDRSEEPWPRTAAEADALWTQRVKADLLAGKLDGRPPEETREGLHKRYERRLGDAADAGSADVLEYVLATLAGCWDPHSTWFKPTSREDFDIEMARSLQGIGAVLQPDGEYTKVLELVPGGPAARGGELQAGDRILAVAQGAEKPVDVVGMRLDHVVRMIRGKKGTEVRLRVIPVDSAPGETRLISIVRDEVKIEADSASLELTEVGEGPDKRKLAVIDIPSFYADTEAIQARKADAKRVSADVRELLLGLDPDAVDAVVLDFRRNGGGSLDEAVRLAGLFLEIGPVVRIRERGGRVDDDWDRDPSVAWRGPLAVLTSPASASAAEIVAAAIQDYRRGVVIGSDRTHGKGTVQQLVGLNPSLSRRLGKRLDEDLGGALKVTFLKFYRVSGGSTQLRGVRSDVIIPSPLDGVDGEGELDGALGWDEIEPSRFPTWGPALDFSGIQAASEARVKASPDLQRVVRLVEESRELRDKGELSLNYEERKAQLERARADRPEDEERDLLLQEALAVTADYVTLLESTLRAQKGR